MKVSQSVINALADLERIAGAGDVRRIVGESMLAVARGDMSGATLCDLCKGSDSISYSMEAEIKVARAKVELRALGENLGRLTVMGNLLIGNAPKEPGDA